MTMWRQKSNDEGKKDQIKVMQKKKILVAKSGFEIWCVCKLYNAPSPNLEKSQVEVFDSRACKKKGLEAICTLLFEDLVIVLRKMVQRLVEPGVV
jgi:hypothetical protein